MVRLALIALILLFVVWLARRLLGGRASPLKCATCRHCQKLFEDGSLCAYGSKETFKTIVHVENCVDHTPR